jgi:hypothetical protein
VRSAHHFDNDIDLGIVQNDVEIMNDPISEGAVGEFTEIEYIANVNATPRGTADAILIFCDDLSGAAANDAEAQQCHC